MRYVISLIILFAANSSLAQIGPPDVSSAPKSSAPVPIGNPTVADAKQSSTVSSNPGAGPSQIDLAQQALLENRFSDAVNRIYAIKPQDDSPEANAILAVGVFALAVVQENEAEVHRAITLGERCLERSLTTPPSDMMARLKVRLTCLSILARAYLRSSDNRLAHERAESCLELVKEVRYATPQAYVAAAQHEMELRRDDRYRNCETVFKKTEQIGFDALGGKPFRFVVVTGQVGYGLRYFLQDVGSSPQRGNANSRLSGWQFEIAAGYPNLRVGGASLRPEILFRWEALSEYPLEPIDDSGSKIKPHLHAANVIGVGVRLALTVPTRIGIFEVGTAGYGAFLTGAKKFEADSSKDVGAAASPEIDLTVRWGSLELREASYAVSFSGFAGCSYAMNWKVDDKDIIAIAFRFGFAMRFRFGEIKPY